MCYFILLYYHFSSITITANFLKGPVYSSVTYASSIGGVNDTLANLVYTSIINNANN